MHYVKFGDIIIIEDKDRGDGELNVKLIVSVLGFIALDIITGLIGAIKNKNYKSSVMREGLFHKCGEILAIIFSYGCEYAFPVVGIDVSLPIAKSIMVYIMIMETGSILENISIISPELRKILEKTFKSYSDSTEKGKHEKE